MGWFSRKPKKKSKPGPQRANEPTLTADASPSAPVPPQLTSAAEFDLSLLGELLVQRLPHVLDQEVDRQLVHARLADAYRDADQQPMAPEKFLAAVEPLDEDGWRRLAVLVGLLDAPHCQELLLELLEHASDEVVSTQIDDAFLRFAHETSLLSVATLRGSELRREEFLRLWLLRLGAGIVGETVEASLDRLSRLDYGKLLGEAKRAQSIAEERMAYLKKLQAADDAARQPRGKW